MEPSTIYIITTGIVGLCVGSIAALIVKRRQLRNIRKKLIGEWRQILKNDKFERKMPLNGPEFEGLWELLNENIRKGLESSSNEISVSIDSPTDDPAKDIILREIARIEKEWGLV